MNIHYNNRLSTIFIFFVSLYSFVLVNLYVLQIRKSDYFKNLGNKQYRVTVTLTPPRAEIYDRTESQPLAMNKDSIAAFILPSRLEEPRKVNIFLSKHFPQAYERLKKNKHLQFLFVKRKLTSQQQALIEKSGLTDIKFLKEPSRFYPIQAVGPLVGITDIDNQGMFGVELLFNQALAGKSSTYSLQKDCSGHFHFKSETKVSGSQGKPLILSIDSILQFLAYEELKETAEYYGSKEGAVLIMNPDTGEIHVMVNYPDFNPNETEHLDLALTKNRITADAHELGSVIKVFLALAALEERVVKSNELIDCENKKITTLDGIKFSTWKANGVITFSEVIENSNNIGVAKVAQRIGPKLYDYYQKLGFGQKIGIFPGENKGFINPPSQWSKASLISLSFGYELSATLLQLAQAFSIIANDGYLVKPRLLKVMPDEVIEKQGPLFNKEAIATLKEILHKTIINGSSKAHINGYSIMGKTGTARVLTNGTYDPNKHIFTFMALVQKGNYKRIVITFLKETNKKGVFASTCTVPLFEKIAQKMLIHDKVISSNTLKEI